MDIVLTPVTAASLDAELSADLGRLSLCLGAEVSEWPPLDGEWDLAAMQYVRSLIDGPNLDLRFVPCYVVAEGVLVANAGFFGPPDRAMEVEIGYSVCRGNRRRGVATAVVGELCRRAWALGCTSVRARVRPDNVGSISALRNNGFVEGSSAPDDEFVVLTLAADGQSRGISGGETPCGR
ncbi:MAG: hypothetical protein RLZZ623_2782 [Actinomycetota bacterium]